MSWFRIIWPKHPQKYYACPLMIDVWRWWWSYHLYPIEFYHLHLDTFPFGSATLFCKSFSKLILKLWNFFSCSSVCVMRKWNYFQMYFNLSCATIYFVIVPQWIFYLTSLICNDFFFYIFYLPVTFIYVHFS